MQICVALITTKEADREDTISQFIGLSFFPLSVCGIYLGKCWPSYIKECGAVERAWSCKSELGFLPPNTRRGPF